MGGKQAALDAELRVHSDIYLASENKCKIHGGLLHARK
ncbi:hypothetical protein Q9966_008575 [Columba livia]|nr:hypothetical protein Q9966_008575 [Columba livia]